ncbi:MAG TPA: hypothetical protein VLJ68_12220 [Chitinophagaceae bacterium]|nr:hypothetical protein [Chitinophagaceae bacterium]
MSLAIDPQNRLQELRGRSLPPQPAALRLIAKIISYLFHPVLVPLYVVWFLLFVHPYLFAGFTAWDKTRVLLQSILMFFFFPVVSVLLMKALKFVETIYLNTQKDRIIPYVACGIWYFWIWYVWRNQPDYPIEAVEFAMGIFLAASLGLMLNIFMKVSMHALAMGVVCTFILGLALREGISSGIYITAALLMAGLVCTARLIVSDHTTKEVYTGLFAGVICQLIGTWLG